MENSANTVNAAGSVTEEQKPKKNKGGAPSKWDYWLTDDGLLLLNAWARDGKTKEQIAKGCGVSRGTLTKWAKMFPSIESALKRGKEPFDIEIENALHDSARGYFVTVKEPIKLKRVRQRAGEGRVEEEYVEYVDRQQYIPPQTAAQIFWLKNRKADVWREKRETEVKVEDTVLKNMQTIATLINNPVADIEIDGSQVQNSEKATPEEAGETDD